MLIHEIIFHQITSFEKSETAAIELEIDPQKPNRGIARVVAGLNRSLQIPAGFG
jgi:hypothetical protein